MTHRTCIDGCRGRLCGRKNLTQRRGSDLDRVEANSMITPIGLVKYQKGSCLKTGKNAIWQ
ncbi:MAG: hypothetical protein Q7J35_01915 [Candidatus Methanoperedens sp.]|nr:hypothetical protein [Candidatus Methanoperedens sp.]